VDGFEGRLVKLRNPWGQGEWKGDWYDDDVMWEDYPTVKEHLVPGGFANDGTFWMDWEDFREQFNQLFLCLDFPDNWKGKRYRGAWVPGDTKTGAGGMPKYPTFPTNPQYTFTVKEKTRGVFIVSQKDNRWQTKGNDKYTTAVGWVIMKLLGDKQRCTKFKGKAMAGMSRTFVPARSVANTIDLAPGRYALVPTTFKPGNKPEKFVLECYTDKTVSYDQDGDDLPDLDEIEAEQDDGNSGDESAPPPEDAESDWEEEGHDDDEHDEDDSGRALGALSGHIAQLTSNIMGLTTKMADLEQRVTKLE
jgi:hypothetical protein